MRRPSSARSHLMRPRTSKAPMVPSYVCSLMRIIADLERRLALSEDRLAATEGTVDDAKAPASSLPAAWAGEEAPAKTTAALRRQLTSELESMDRTMVCHQLHSRRRSAASAWHLTTLCCGVAGRTMFTSTTCTHATGRRQRSCAIRHESEAVGGWWLRERDVWWVMHRRYRSSCFGTSGATTETSSWSSGALRAACGMCCDGPGPGTAQPTATRRL